MKALTMTWTLALCVAVGACAKSSDKDKAGASAARPQETKAAGPTHAPKDVVPGSHEDWCEEHQVPESLDTQCDPKLVAAFKATGDWCEEHGVPESQCRKCNPDLKIVRPE